jgi:hypothetical protein
MTSLTSCSLSSIVAELFILCADILVYVAWYRTCQIWLQVSCKFLASFLQVSCKFLASFLQVSCKFLASFLQVSCKFLASFILNLYLNETGSFLCMRGYSCVCSLVQNLTSFFASFLQVSCKFLASFVFKLASEFLKNQTCARVASLCLGICWLCTGHFRVAEKSNLYASCTPLTTILQVSS